MLFSHSKPKLTTASSTENLRPFQFVKPPLEIRSEIYKLFLTPKRKSLLDTHQVILAMIWKH
jgi:hypothetical protein